MLRRLEALLALGMCTFTASAAAQEEPPAGDSPPPDAEPETFVESADGQPAPSEPGEPTGVDNQLAAPEQPSQEPAPERTTKPESQGQERARGEEPSAAPVVLQAPAEPEPEGWDTFVSGYFRAPLAMGISQRPTASNPDGPAKPQVSYGPTRTMDSNYYSFAYTRLQEQDWAEVFIGARKRHVEAAVGMMGYWYQGVGFRNNDAAWAPATAYVKLDTDFAVGGIDPHVALTMGAFWPRFGNFEKYDTYTLGQFRQLGQQLRLTVPLSPDFSVALVQGFGSGRNGNYNSVSPPPYQASVGLMLLHYEHLEVSYRDLLDVGLHYNAQWTRDPHIWESTVRGKAFEDVAQAKLSTIGGEARLKLAHAGSVWVSPSYIQIKNGWALANAGVEVMHSLGGEGLATNYLGWSGSLPDSTGSGSLKNLGFLYENTLSNLLTGSRAEHAPELTLNVFGLFADITLDLPEGSSISQDRIGQLKYGADLEYQATDWLGFMLRWDEVNYNLDHAGYAFSAITPRVTFSSHFLSGESIYLQYSRYRYGDRMVIAGTWPWGTPLVAGSSITQGDTYTGEKPDMDVVKLQASIAF